MASDYEAPPERAGLADFFIGLGRELSTRHTVDEILQTVSHRATELVPRAEQVSITREEHGRFQTIAATSDLPVLLDEIQYERRSGPCVDAILTDSVIRVGDLEHSDRWPEFGSEAAQQHRIQSILSVRLHVPDDYLLAGLNMYATSRNAFDESDQTAATLLATHGALALATARRQNKVDNLERALLTSRRIGIAVGIVMATRNVADEQAFDMLRIISQSTRRKLYDVAEQVAETGLLGLPDVSEEPHRT